jgi:hypothetical protein
MDSLGNPREDDKEQRSSEEVRRLRNLAENLGRQAERVCVTWSIFELKNTSGVNYVFILGRSSMVEAAVTIRRYGSNDGRL